MAELRIEGARIDIKAVAGADQVDDQQTEEQSQGGNDFEVEDGFAADSSDFCQVAQGSDSMDHGAKDDRGDEHFDQFDKGLAEGLHRLAERGKKISEEDARSDGHEDLDVEHAVERLGWPGHRHLTLLEDERGEIEAIFE